jgi:diguanylate cyclase (GGDEF)-like protein
LAERAKSLDSPTVTSDIESINSWYVESFSLKKAMLSGVKLLHNQIGDLKRDADTDPLTGANNRRAFQYKLKQLALLETPFAILALDIDYFKLINDQYGHSVGDEVLKQQTQILQGFSRDGDLVARTGGEEFVLLLKDVTVDDAFIIAERLRVAIAEETFETVGHVTASIGISAWSANSISVEKTLSLADQALYQAKKQGRNCCVMRSLEDAA